MEWRGYELGITDPVDTIQVNMLKPFIYSLCEGSWPREINIGHFWYEQITIIVVL